jgi:hypothetical protein
VLTDSYDFQLASDVEFKIPVETLKIKDNVGLVRVKAPGTYFWRIRGLTRACASPWSAARKVIVR